MFGILIISIYFCTVNCISEKSCSVKCELVHYDIDTVSLVINNTCHCAKQLGTVYVDKNFDYNLYCQRKYNINDSYYGNYNYLGGNDYSFDCYQDYKCNSSLCEDYCNLEHSGEIFESYCHEGVECKCKCENANNRNSRCIVSTDRENSIVEFHPQNNIAVNDILFNLKGLLNLHLCPLVPEHKYNVLSVVNGTILALVNGKIVNPDVNKLTYNECEISCQSSSLCERCFNCYPRINYEI